MKKLISILLCALLLLTMVACDNSPEENGSKEETTEKTVVTTDKEDKTTEKEETTKAEETTAEKEETTKAPEQTETETEPATPAVDSTLTFDENTASEDHTYTLGYKWDKDTKTLTLSGLEMVCKSAIGIMLVGDANLVIEDNSFNNITVTGFIEDENHDFYLGCYGIICTGKLTVSGEGTLNITSGDFISDVIATGTSAFGICAKGQEVVWKSGTVNIVCGTVGDNAANLRNIQGIRALNLTVEGGKINIETGDCFTTDTKGAFLDGIYAEENYTQKDGEVHVNIGYCHIIGDELWKENLGICADVLISVEGGFLEVQAGNGSALGGAVDISNGKSTNTILLGDGTITAGPNNRGSDDYYDSQLYVKVVY